MQIALLNDVEGDLDDDAGLDGHGAALALAEAVREKPLRHLGDLHVGQARVGLADGQQRAVFG